MAKSAKSRQKQSKKASAGGHKKRTVHHQKKKSSGRVHKPEEPVIHVEAEIPANPVEAAAEAVAESKPNLRLVKGMMKATTTPKDMWDEMRRGVDKASDEMKTGLDAAYKDMRRAIDNAWEEVSRAFDRARSKLQDRRSKSA